LDDFAEAFAAQAEEVLTEADLEPVTRIDAIVPGRVLTLELAAELQGLAPFGLGNPGVTLLAAGCGLTDLAAVGAGKHLRLGVVDEEGTRAGAIAFGLGSQVDRFQRPGRYDVAFRLEQNHWNGTVAPQLVVRRIFDSPERYRELRGRFAREWRSSELSPEAQAILGERGELGWRSLLESETFQALLADAPPLAAAA